MTSSAVDAMSKANSTKPAIRRPNNANAMPSSAHRPAGAGGGGQWSPFPS